MRKIYSSRNRNYKLSMLLILLIIVAAIGILAFKVLKGAIKVAVTSVVIALILYALTHIMI